jgi:hypothetical protein
VVKSGGNFVLSFTGTLSLAELRPLVEHEILMLLDDANDFIKESISRSEVRNISMFSMRALIFGFLGIALGLSVFRKGRK